MLNLPIKLSKNWLLLQCLSLVLSQPRSFAVNMTYFKLMTHTSNMITTQSHSAATDPGNYAQMLSCYSVLTWMAKCFNEEIRIEKKLSIGEKKTINSEFQCNFLIDCNSCYTSI